MAGPPRRASRLAVCSSARAAAFVPSVCRSSSTIYRFSSGVLSGCSVTRVGIRKPSRSFPLFFFSLFPDRKLTFSFIGLFAKTTTETGRRFSFVFSVCLLFSCFFQGCLRVITRPAGRFRKYSKSHGSGLVGSRDFRPRGLGQVGSRPFRASRIGPVWVKTFSNFTGRINKR